MTLALTSIAHLFVDGLCAASLLGSEADPEKLAIMLLIYNTLAFSTQCIAGMILDGTGYAKNACRISMIVLVIGGLIPFGNIIKSCIMGLGNSLFHAAAGSMTIMRYPGRAAELGVFVAPGALGVTSGSLWPVLRIPFASGLLIAAVFLGQIKEEGFDGNLRPEADEEAKALLPEAVLLTAAVAVRAVGGCAVSFPWNRGNATALTLTFFVFAGKALGGLVLQKLGTVKTALISIVPATLCIALFASDPVLSIAGQFLLNLTMPVTLFLLVKALPGSPGLAFGLAASALWPGTLAGGLMLQSGQWQIICIIISFIFSLTAVLFCERRLAK